VIYACKCDVPKKQLKADMQECFDVLRTYKHDNELTQEDVDSAMECYSKDYYNFTIADIEILTDVRIERNKRNGRKQDVHLKIARATRDIVNDNWREGNGRPIKKQLVYDWLWEHPFGKKIECERDTGLSRHTVLKWWSECQREVFHRMDEEILEFCMESKYTKEDIERMLLEAAEMEKEGEPDGQDD